MDTPREGPLPLCEVDRQDMSFCRVDTSIEWGKWVRGWESWHSADWEAWCIFILGLSFTVAWTEIGGVPLQLVTSE